MYHRTENLRESVLSFHHVGPGDRAQIIRVSNKCHPAHLFFSFFLEAGSHYSIAQAGFELTVMLVLQSPSVGSTGVQYNTIVI